MWRHLHRCAAPSLGAIRQWWRNANHVRRLQTKRSASTSRMDREILRARSVPADTPITTREPVVIPGNASFKSPELWYLVFEFWMFNYGDSCELPIQANPFLRCETRRILTVFHWKTRNKREHLCHMVHDQATRTRNIFATEIRCAKNDSCHIVHHLALVAWAMSAVISVWSGSEGARYMPAKVSVLYKFT